jgi:hypothetical protein
VQRCTREPSWLPQRQAGKLEAGGNPLYSDGVHECISAMVTNRL